MSASVHSTNAQGIYKLAFEDVLHDIATCIILASYSGEDPLSYMILVGSVFVYS